MEHQLKIQLKPFNDLTSGRKTCEVRNCGDRQFREGDTVQLNLIDETSNPTGVSVVRLVTHVQHGYGLPDNVCVLSYAPAEDVRAMVDEPVAFYDKVEDHLCIIGHVQLQDQEYVYRHAQRHTMKSVMQAICEVPGPPMLTSNQCADLAKRLNGDQS